jgi:hypothetical protein
VLTPEHISFNLDGFLFFTHNILQYKNSLNGRPTTAS